VAGKLAIFFVSSSDDTPLDSDRELEGAATLKRLLC
jgi:hypothetical protein